MKAKPGPNLLEQNIAYWSIDHSDEYKKAKQLFIELVMLYNKDHHLFSQDEKQAFATIHKLWRRKLYNSYPSDIYNATIKQH